MSEGHQMHPSLAEMTLQAGVPLLAVIITRLLEALADPDPTAAQVEAESILAELDAMEDEEGE